MTIELIQKPMLAATLTDSDLHKVEWPAIATPKIDGIRVLTHPKLGPVTRSFKPLPNKHVREQLDIACHMAYLDGELIATDPLGRALDFNATQSALMSRSGQPEYVFWVFDCFLQPNNTYEDRLKDAYDYVRAINSRSIRYLSPQQVDNPEEFALFAQVCVEAGYEGVCIRHPEGPYKSGRSTLNQGWLLKYKQWHDAEGVVIGVEEKMHNDNEDIKDNFGYAKRTSHKDGLRPAGTLGALVLNTEWGELRVGTGFDDFTRDTIWMLQAGAIGKVATFKYQAFGMQDKPRFPVFKGFREEE